MCGVPSSVKMAAVSAATALRASLSLMLFGQTVTKGSDVPAGGQNFSYFQRVPRVKNPKPGSVLIDAKYMELYGTRLCLRRKFLLFRSEHRV